MSDYTPDMESMSIAWEYQAHVSGATEAEAKPEFDRFIAKVKADALREYATEMEANKSAQVWDHTDFAFDIRVWADEIEGEA